MVQTVSANAQPSVKAAWLAFLVAMALSLSNLIAPVHELGHILFGLATYMTPWFAGWASTQINALDPSDDAISGLFIAGGYLFEAIVCYLCIKKDNEKGWIAALGTGNALSQLLMVLVQTDSSWPGFVPLFEVLNIFLVILGIGKLSRLYTNQHKKEEADEIVSSFDQEGIHLCVIRVVINDGSKELFDRRDLCLPEDRGYTVNEWRAALHRKGFDLSSVVAID